MGHDDFTIRFWGVRGSIACSGPETMRYGGNTSSLEVHCGDRLLLFDAGSGIRYLGNVLYDADLIEQAAKRPDNELVQAQRSTILDPNDPKVIAEARGPSASQ